MTRRICIDCHHTIQGESTRRVLCDRCRKAHAVAAHKRKTNTTTRGNSVATVIAKGHGAPRPKRKVNLNFSDIMHAPEGKAADWINRILNGEMSVTG